MLNIKRFPFNEACWSSISWTFLLVDCLL